MKLLFDFFPLLLFFAAFKFYGVYVATAAAMAASLVQIGYAYYRHRRVETVMLVTAVVILILGGLTLAFKDDAFIKWKPTIVDWIFAALLLGSQFLGNKTAVEFVLGTQLKLPRPVWRKLNLSWGLFFLATGAANIYVAFFYGLNLSEAARTAIWVDFKVFGLFGLTLLFTIAQAFYLAKHIEPDSQESES